MKTSLQSEPMVLAVSPSVCSGLCLGCARWGSTCRNPVRIGSGGAQLRSGEDADVPTARARCFKWVTQLGTCPKDWADLQILWGEFGFMAPLLHLMVSAFNCLCVFFCSGTLMISTQCLTSQLVPPKNILNQIHLPLSFSTCEIKIIYKFPWYWSLIVPFLHSNLKHITKHYVDLLCINLHL